MHQTEFNSQAIECDTAAETYQVLGDNPRNCRRSGRTFVDATNGRGSAGEIVFRTANRCCLFCALPAIVERFVNTFAAGGKPMRSARVST